MVSDIVLLKPLPEKIKESVEAYVGCIAGALLKEDYLEAIRKAGFTGIEVPDEAMVYYENKPDDAADNPDMGKETDMENSIVSARISAFKPR